MEKDVVGYRFQPTEVELINHYLKNKNLGNSSWLVDNGIKEINICSYEPMFLPSLSKIESKDLAWYFFSPKVYTSAKKTDMKRTTRFGYWKVTGKDRKIKDKRVNGVEIGIMKPLAYHHGRSPNGVRTPWAINEYHITCLPNDQNNYVICLVTYNGEDRNLSEPSHSLACDLNTVVEQQGGLVLSDLTKSMDNDNYANVQQQAPYSAQGDDDFLSGLKHVNRGHVEHLFSDQENVSPCEGFNANNFLSFDSYNNGWKIKYDEFSSGLVGSSGGNDDEDVFLKPEVKVQANHNDHRPNTSLSVFIVDRSCDSNRDAESRSSDPDSSKDLQTWESQLTCRTIPKKQEVKEGKFKIAVATIDKAEKKGWFITEDAMHIKGKTPRYIYLMNMIIGFILLVALTSKMSYLFY
ncbi:unnamed protein product [Microthlaspi erraticum]|uniref:NAC domain-containing protein n=1 Tax=Microthlaspi erraticum TaxID=1685480 RepID=A0A6D2HB92_9BRAS|nr:unnamed protein product [Microthlaspi erraticum]